MKKTFIILGLIICSFTTYCQSLTNFEDLNLGVDTFWSGDDLSGGFQSGGLYFKNYYDTSWFYFEGFAYSSKSDSITTGYSNQFSAITGSGHAGDGPTYGIAYQNATILVQDSLALLHGISGCYITNTTYAYHSMLLGDGFAKKFGGNSGIEPDWFKVIIKGYHNGNVQSQDFFLADYRDSNNTNDYIIKEWTWVDLSTMGPMDSLNFTFESTDTTAWGINTPSYIAVDGFRAMYPTEIPFNNELKIRAQNPINNNLHIYSSFRKDHSFKLWNIHGVEVLSELIIAPGYNSFATDNLAPGMYFIKENKPNGITQSLLKL